jgi:FlaA1/EpsC-like NDP-sugar epimerase
MSSRLKAVFLMVIDAIIVMVTPCLALYIRFDGDVEPQYFNQLFRFLPIIVVVWLGVFYRFGLYNRLWRYASINELLAITGAVTVSSIITSVPMYYTGTGLPRMGYFLNWVLSIVFIGGSRLIVRIQSHLRNKISTASKSVLIIGAGDAGAMIAREIQQRYADSKKLVGFIDDDKNKKNQMLFGVKVLGTRDDIGSIVASHNVQEIIIALPSIGGDVLREIIGHCKKSDCKVLTVPGLYELIDGKVTVQQLRNVDLEDLLRRDQVRLDIEQIASYVRGKRVLVTGAGGSIGSEICRQIARLSPGQLVLLGKGENSIYEIHQELIAKHPKLVPEPVIADVRDRSRIQAIFRRVKPHVVFHAAAHKHVPLMEAQPEEAVRNNILGTKVVADAADRHGAEIFVMISTDKAVNPTSVMGATKRVAELIIQLQNRASTTKYVAVRFGNVLGSRGSVIPLFKRQIADGGPVTITHPEMQRYFMTISEATQLVLQAGAMATGGEVFVLDMGEPVKIVDMACDLIELSGLVPHKDIAIEFTGLRPGEKLFEELLTAEEGTRATKHEKIFVANLRQVDEAKLQRILAELEGTQNPGKIIGLLMQAVPTYQGSTRQELPVAKIT